MQQTAENNFLLGDIPHDIYLANPEWFTESGRIMIQERVLPSLVNAGVTVYEPFREFYARATQKFGEFDLSKREICLFGAYSNVQAIKSAKMILAVLDGVDVDSGTASEIWWGSMIWKRIVGIRTDFRWNSADGVAVKINLQVEWFISMSGGIICDSYASGVSTAIEYIHSLR